MKYLGALGCLLVATLVFRQPARLPAPPVLPGVTPITPPGHTLQPRAGVVIHDGTSTLTISPDGRLGGVDALPDNVRETLRLAFVSHRIQPVPAARGLAGQTGTLLGSSSPPPAVLLIQPVGEVIEPTRPVFRRTAKVPADFLVSVYDRHFNLSRKKRLIDYFDLADS